MKRLAGIESRWRGEQKCFTEFSDELTAISQRGKNAVEMIVRRLCCALVGVTGIFMFEKADDLQISFLRIGADHLDGQFDAQRLRLKYIFRWRWRISSPRSGDENHRREAQNENFAFHICYVFVNSLIGNQCAFFGTTCGFCADCGA